MEWISVKDRLPQDDDHNCSHDFVLVSGKSSNSHNNDWVISIASWNVDRWHFVANNDILQSKFSMTLGATWDCGPYWEFTSLEITHWMPLPEKPKD